MKKFILTALIIGSSLPTFASCSVTGFCTSGTSVFTDSSITDKYVPNYLEEIQKPTAFTPQYYQPYNDLLLNVEQPEATPQTTNEESSYNANCQFGVCIPSSGLMENP